VLSGKKILLTGAAGQIGFPLTEFLAAENEVWGVARFSEPGSRERVEATGATTRVIDLGEARFDDLPTDFTYVVHLAVLQEGGLDYDRAISVNAEGTGLLLQHCRSARAALVMSTQSVYRPVEDPHHAFHESDPLGDCNSMHAPTYSISKISEEAVSRYCARAFGLPITIARMNASYGANGGLPTYHLDWIMAGAPVVTRWDPCPYDINHQTEALLAAASVPATIVNWGGDEAVTVQEWCSYIGELAGVTPTVETKPVPGTLRGSVADPSRRLALTGPGAVSWRDGIRRTFEHRYPGGASTGTLDGPASRLLAAYRAPASSPDP
jgi:nucleoside-diphosphate-sugar epimerase